MKITIQNLSKAFGGRDIFSDFSLDIDSGVRLCVCGPNGCGKSTLIRMLADADAPDSGRIIMPRGCRVGYVQQDLDEAVLDTPLLEWVVDVLPDWHDFWSAWEAAAASKDEAAIARLGARQAELEALYGYNPEHKAQAVLSGLGFDEGKWHLPIKQLSGGWRERAKLARVLVAGADVLLLDEPTNHLDIESIQWLEDFLINNGKAVIVISHDRKFVDNITTRTIEVTMGRIYDYKVNYSQYLQLRKERREQQQKAYDEQQKFIAETEAFIERFKGTYSKTLQVQSRVKMLEKLELLEVDEEDTSALRLKFPPSPRSGSYPVTMEGVGKTYGDHVVFRNANLTIERGDKVAFVGKNGEGKSTLVKCIMNEIDHDGTLTLGHNVQIGYFAQNQASLMDENLTVFQTIDDVAKGEIRNKIRDLLGAFMFGGPEESMKKVKVLSGGERTRLAMIKLLLEPVNLLILDEPTNHLDMKTKDILKQALMDFDGTLIVVSHDRDFLDGLVTKVYEFGNKKVTEHLRGIYEFLEKKKMDSLQELEKK